MHILNRACKIGIQMVKKKVNNTANQNAAHVKQTTTTKHFNYARSSFISHLEEEGVGDNYMELSARIYLKNREEKKENREKMEANVTIAISMKNICSLFNKQA